MLFLRSKIKLTESGFFRGFTDFHSHVLPGVDDGMASLEEALEALDYLGSLGVGMVVCTPHVMNGMKGGWGDVERAFEELGSRYQGEVRLQLAGEYMLDGGFEECMQGGLRCIAENRVLLETSYLSPPNNLYELLYNVSVSGWVPVMAHPERYVYMGCADYFRLKERGVLLQLNILSLSGYYGTRVQRNAEFLLEEGMYDLSGTDLHKLAVLKRWIDEVKFTQKQLNALLKLRG